MEADPVPAAARRTQSQRREQSGRGLVQAAVGLVADEGVSAATFHAIGQASGYSRSLVTQRFGSKAGLIDAVIAYIRQSLEDMLATNGLDELPGLEALLLYMDLYLTHLSANREVRAYFVLLSSAVADLGELRAAFAAEHERVRQRLAALVARGQAEGGIRPQIDADAAALIIGALQLGLSMQLLVDPALDLEPIRRTSLATLRASFAAA
jgi:AcrR family transcriptional regulator